MDHNKFFVDDDYYSGPPATESLIHAAEVRLGYRLPVAYRLLLGERNGGVPLKRCIRTDSPTSWAADHVEVAAILGVGGKWGIDTANGLGSEDQIAEWGYPDIGIVICQMPSGGHDTIMLDYSRCGPDGDPTVVYIDEDRRVRQIAENFGAFITLLCECDQRSVASVDA